MVGRSQFVWIVAAALAVLAPLAAGAEDSDPAGPDLALYRSGDSFLRPTLTIEAAAFSESNAWLGESRTVVGNHVGYWREYAVTGGLEGALALDEAGSLFGRVSGIGAGSQGLDAAGSNFDDEYPENLELEDAYLGWRSGKLFPSLDENALELSVGKLAYAIGSGFLLRDGASDGGRRGAYWIAPRKAFYMTAVAKLQTGPYKVEGFYLKPNDEAFTSTDVVGGNFEYTAGETGTLGVSYLKITDSQSESRDGMDVFDWRLDLTPIPRDRSLQLRGEFALERNGSSQDSSAWYAEAGYAFDETSWTPFVSYRYAWFEGDDAGSDDLEVWDPLWYGFDDWSTWYVGEVIGAFVALNRDLALQTVRLGIRPDDALTLQVVYNRYRLVDPVSEVVARDLNPRAANIHSKHIGQGFDFITDWTANEHLSFSAVAAAFDPGAGMRQYAESDGGTWWLHFMLHAKVSY